MIFKYCVPLSHQYAHSAALHQVLQEISLHELFVTASLLRENFKGIGSHSFFIPWIF